MVNECEPVLWREVDGSTDVGDLLSVCSARSLAAPHAGAYLHMISFEELVCVWSDVLCHRNHLKHFFQNVVVLFWALIKANNVNLGGTAAW